MTALGQSRGPNRGHEGVQAPAPPVELCLQRSALVDTDRDRVVVRKRVDAAVRSVRPGTTPDARHRTGHQRMDDSRD